MKNNKNHSKIIVDHIKQWLNTYLPQIRCCSPRTVSSYRQVVLLYLDYLETYMKIKPAALDYNCFSRDTVEEWLKWLVSERECSLRTRDHRLACIRSLMNYIQSKDKNLILEYIDICEIKNLSHGKGNKVEGISKKLLKVFFSCIARDNNIGIRDYALFLLMYDTGCRVGEAIGLHISDVFLNVQKPYIVVDGKGGKRRILLLSPQTVEALRLYYDVAFKKCLKDDYYIFYSSHKGKMTPITDDSVNCRLQSIAVKANKLCSDFPLHFHSHQLRHTAATHWYMDGVNIGIISRYLGHEQIETTRIYLGISREEMEQALAKREDFEENTESRYKKAGKTLRSLIEEA